MSFSETELYDGHLIKCIKIITYRPLCDLVYYSSFIANIATDSVALGTLFVPMILSGSNIFKENQGSSFEVYFCVVLYNLQFVT